MKEVRNGQGRWLFAANFFKHPTMLGSIIPSSRYLVNHLLETVDWDRARYIVEYGPGVGTITREILARMRPDCRLLVVELNRDFVDYLQRELSDPRLEVLHGSAADIDDLVSERGWDGIDYAVSGIPFSTMPAGIRDSVLETTRTTLRPGGEFLVFQFSNKVFPYLRDTFDVVDKGFVLRNVLPAHCYRCSNRAEEAEMQRMEAGVAQG